MSAAVTVRRARQTGTLVTVVSAADEGLDPGDAGETRWYTICNEHSTAIGHSSRRMALAHASDPCGWCEFCERIERCPHDGTVLDFTEPEIGTCPKCGDEWFR